MNIKSLPVHTKHVEGLGNTTLAKLLPFARLVYRTPNMPFEFLVAWLSLRQFSFGQTLHYPLSPSKHFQLKGRLLPEARRDDLSSD